MVGFMAYLPLLDHLMLKALFLQAIIGFQVIIIIIFKYL